ncbi:MAG: hypothetical protein P8Y64_07070 [Gammaproteobacteria bacterium]|jgi:hypothetical protein
MSDMILEPTAVAQWQHVVREASSEANRNLPDDIEAYLVLTLQRHIRDTEGLQRRMALDYLSALQNTGALRGDALQTVGDHCLLLAGLFPQQATRRQVQVGYFVDLGRAAYRDLGEQLRASAALLFQRLAEAFLSLTEVLHALRNLGGAPALTAAEALDFWSETGSAYALQTLRRHTGSLPARSVSRKRH